MELTTDVTLLGEDWIETIEKLGPILKGHSDRTHYNIFMLALSLGIMYDKRIESSEIKEHEQSKDENGEIIEVEYKSVPRNVLQNNDNGKFDFIFQAAVLSTKTLELSEQERLELAFGEKSDESFNKMKFLVSFANYGVTKLREQIGETDIESMENIKNFLCSTIEGNNFDINEIPDDIWLDDEEFL